MGTPTAVDRWSALLDAYEQHLDRQEAFLAAVTTSSGPDGDLVPPGAFAPPPDLPPPPVHLSERLDALQARTAGLQEMSTVALSQLGRAGRRRRASESTVASVFDRTV